MKRLLILTAAVFVALTLSMGQAVACGHQPPPPCGSWSRPYQSTNPAGDCYQPPPPCHHDCLTPTSPKPATTLTHKQTSKNHCHVRVVKVRTVKTYYRWDTHLCKWVKCVTVTVKVTLRRHASHCGSGHHHVKLPKAGTTMTTTCAVKGCKV